MFFIILQIFSYVYLVLLGVIIVNVKKIVTHSGNAHMDDLLGVALLAFKYAVPIERKVNINAFEQGTIYVDIGRKYDPPYLLDHHQSIDIPCSLILVLRHHFPELEKMKIPEIRYIDMRDRFGLNKVVGTPIPSEMLFFERIFTRWFANISYLSPEDEEYYILKWLGKRFYGYIRNRYEELKRYDKVISTANEEVVDGIKILLLDDDVPPYEVLNRRTDVHVIIQPSSRDPNQYSVIKLAPYQDKISLDEVAKRLDEEGKLIFYHANKFMLVAADKDSVLKYIKYIRFVDDEKS